MESSLIDLRKELHQFPEISGQEEETSERIRNELGKLAPDEIRSGIGGYGILACFKCKNRDKKNILFRAELDAISVNEESDLAYKSMHKNVMHGCGHDGHMSILIGLAQRLNSSRPDNVDVYLLFQPSEETGEGAARVLEDPVFQKLSIDQGFALHNLPGFPEKTVVCKKKTFAAGSVGIEISVNGAYSHAAYPDRGINPSTVVAKLIRKIDSGMDSFRKEDEGNKLVCTFIKMGERAFGISPGKARIGYTIRSKSDEILEKAVGEIRKIILNIGHSFEGEINIKEVEPFRATVNSRQGVEIIKQVSEKKRYDYLTLEQPFPWSEDFGEFRRQFPITIFGLGAGENHPPLHSETYDFNDDLISVGIDMFAGIVDYYSSL